MGPSEYKISRNKSKSDNRELIFFSLLFVIIYVKFYLLEQTVSSHATRSFISAASSAGISLCFTVTTSIFWRKIRAFTALTVDFLLSLLVVTDLLHLRYYSDMFTMMNIGLSTQVGEIADSVIALIQPTDFLYFLDIPLFIFFIFLSGKFTIAPFFKKVTLKRLMVSLLLLIIGISLIFYRFETYGKKVPGVLRSMWDRPAVCNNVGALTYHLADARNAAEHFLFKGSLSEEEIAEVKEFLNDRNNSRTPSRLSGVAKGKNLIIIQVESLQQFVVGLTIKGVEVTPNLNKFIKESIYFSRTYNQTASGNSSDAEFLVNTGLYPSAAGVAYTKYAGNKYEALPKVLSEQSYVSLALHGDRPGFWNRNRMYPSMGFNRFISKKDFVAEESIGLGLSDGSFFRQSIGILEDTQKPFYAFLITLTSHYPYNFKGIFTQTELDTGSLDGTLMGNYLTSIKYFDNHFGKFIEELRNSGLLDSSVIALYGDHTAIPKWDRANLEKLLGKSLKNGWEWKDIQRIPLVIRIPYDQVISGEKRVATGLIDLPETLADLMGFEFKAGFGTNLFENNRNVPVIFRNGSFVVNNVFVEPYSEKATDMTEGEELDYSKYSEMAEEVKKRLNLSDRILEYNLLPKVLRED